MAIMRLQGNEAEEFGIQLNVKNMAANLNEIPKDMDEIEAEIENAMSDAREQNLKLTEMVQGHSVWYWFKSFGGIVLILEVAILLFVMTTWKNKNIFNFEIAGIKFGNHHRERV
jgi:hypothetical protein